MENLKIKQLFSLVKLVSHCLVIIFLSACNSETPNIEKPIEEAVKPKPISIVPEIKYSITNRFPHDTASFTEGFLFHENELFESTGSPSNLPYTKSVFGNVDLKTGKINVKAELDKIYFGEGIVFLNNKISQLTYTNQVGFIYDAKTFEKTGEFRFSNKEGWGLTTDATNIIMSDGTYKLYYLNPADYSVIKVIDVTENGYALDYLNELEFINGYIYANVWQTNFIVKINPATGIVEGKLDLTPLFEEVNLKHFCAETNGIAFNPRTNTIFVTGKLWGTIFELQLN